MSSLLIRSFQLPLAGAILALMSSATAVEAVEDKFLGSLWQNWSNVEDAAPLLGSLFNQVTPENAGKWAPVQRDSSEQWRWQRLDAMAEFAEQHNMLVKQHAFFWGHQHSVPQWLDGLSDAEIAAAAENWIREFCQRYPDIAMIDVVNEAPHDPPPYREALGGAGESGWDWLLWSYEKAREYAPNATLILNDYNVLRYDSDMQDMISLAQLLQNEGLVDAIGCQAHFLVETSVSDVKERLDTLYATTGLPIYISEFDCNLVNDSEHAEKFSALFTLFWEHPAVRGITLWGHLKGTMWQEHGWLIDQEGNEREALTWLRGYLAQAAAVASAPSPADGAVDVSPLALTLAWQHGSAATKRRIYLAPESVPSNEDLLAEQYDLQLVLPHLAPGTTYHWRVDEGNANGFSEGSSWSFTTAPGQRQVRLGISGMDSSSSMVTVTPEHGQLLSEPSPWVFDALSSTRSYEFNITADGLRSNQ